MDESELAVVKGALRAKLRRVVEEMYKRRDFLPEAIHITTELYHPPWGGEPIPMVKVEVDP